MTDLKAFGIGLTFAGIVLVAVVISLLAVLWVAAVVQVLVVDPLKRRQLAKHKADAILAETVASIERQADESVQRLGQAYQDVAQQIRNEARRSRP